MDMSLPLLGVLHDDCNVLWKIIYSQCSAVVQRQNAMLFKTARLVPKDLILYRLGGPSCAKCIITSIQVAST